MAKPIWTAYFFHGTLWHWTKSMDSIYIIYWTQYTRPRQYICVSHCVHYNICPSSIVSIIMVTMKEGYRRRTYIVLYTMEEGQIYIPPLCRLQYMPLFQCVHYNICLSSIVSITIYALPPLLNEVRCVQAGKWTVQQRLESAATGGRRSILNTHHQVYCNTVTVL